MKKSVKYVVLGAVLAIAFFGIVNVSYACKPSDYGLQEGDLISAIFSDDPDVYIVNEHGYKRLFLNPEIFKMYGHLGGFFNVKLVPTEVRDAFITSGLFRNCEANDPKVYGINVDGEDTGTLHWVNVTAENAVSEDREFFKKVFCINNNEYGWYPKGGEFKKVKDIPGYERKREMLSTQEKLQEKYQFKNIGKTVICHYPEGNPGAHHTLTISTAALQTHLDHGDTVGACADESSKTYEKDTTAPSVPTNLTATPVYHSKIQLSWTASADNVKVVGYKIYRNGVKIAATGGTNYLDIGLTPSTTYTYTVAAYDAMGNLSEQSEPASATTLEGPVADTEAPSVPTNLVATPIYYHKIGLTWTASTDNVGVVGYKIYRDGVKIGSTSGTSHHDSGLIASTTYSYTVAAYDKAGNISAQCGAVSATTPEGPDTTAPSAPTDLVATAVSSSQINLTWTVSTDNVALKGYKIYRNGTLIATSTTNSYSNTGLVASTEYTYTVAAYDTAHNISAQSNSATATTLEL